MFIWSTSFLISSLDKALHSLGYKYGYALPKAQLPNPINIVMVYAQKVMFSWLFLLLVFLSLLELTHWCLCWPQPSLLSVGLCSSSDVIIFDQNWHHLYSSSAGGKVPSNATQIRVILPMEPWNMHENLQKFEWKTGRKISCDYIHVLYT